jgi:hypothetical protein
MVEEANSTMIHCKHFYKCHNVPLSTINNSKKKFLQWDGMLIDLTLWKRKGKDLL